MMMYTMKNTQNQKDIHISADGNVNDEKQTESKFLIH